MKQKTFNTIGIIGSCLIMVALIAVLLSQKVSASVDYSAAGYQSTTTRTYNGTALANLSTVSQGFGILGSVVITGASTGIINIYDATTSTNGAIYGTTTIASFPASTAAGTYTFDATYNRGLLIELIGTTGTSTITWKH